ncbi:MAG TPA: hypothetical protein DCM49_05120 [Lachnospiraceae bacterium]|nr:hypothetical protein [Lachnospiraceae bacterium]
MRGRNKEVHMEKSTVYRRGIGNQYYLVYKNDGTAWFGVTGQKELVPVRYDEGRGLYPRESAYEYEFDKILLMITPGDRTVYLEDGGLNLYPEDMNGKAYEYGPAEEITVESENAFDSYDLQIIEKFEAASAGNPDNNETGIYEIWLAAPADGNKVLLLSGVGGEEKCNAVRDIRKDVLTREFIETVDEELFRFLVGIDMDA